MDQSSCAMQTYVRYIQKIGQCEPTGAQLIESNINIQSSSGTLRMIVKYQIYSRSFIAIRYVFALDHNSE